MLSSTIWVASGPSWIQVAEHGQNGKIPSLRHVSQEAVGSSKPWAPTAHCRVAHTLMQESMSTVTAALAAANIGIRCNAPWLWQASIHSILQEQDMHTRNRTAYTSHHINPQTHNSLAQRHLSCRFKHSTCQQPETRITTQPSHHTPQSPIHSALWAGRAHRAKLLTALSLSSYNQLGWKSGRLKVKVSP
jgi:hypothetical protein